MSQDEIRKLIGGYATGTLTEAERKALFDAALDDQDLFDELAREQSLKELLDSPGARTRLTAVLAPPEPKWSANRLRLAIGGMLAAGFAIALGIVLVVRKPPAENFAALTKTESQVAESRAALPEPPKVTAPAVPSDAPAPLPPQGVKQPTPKTQSVGNAIAPLPPPVLLQPPSEDALKKAESARRDEPAKSDSVAPAQRERDAATKPLTVEPADKALTDEKDAAPPRPQPQTETVQVQNVQLQQVPSGVGRQQASQSVSVAPAPPALVTNGVSSGAALAAPRVAALAGKVGAARFAFDYSLRRDSLTVNPLAAGFLQVTATVAGGQPIVLQAAARQEAGTSVTMPIPAGSLNLTIEFSARPAIRDLAASLDTLQNSRFRAKTSAPAAPAIPPAVSKNKTGHVEEQTPTPYPSLSITVAVPAE